MHYFQLGKKPTGVQHKTHDRNRVQLNIVEYLGCGLGVNLSGESMEIKSLRKIIQSYNSYLEKKRVSNSKIT